MVLGNAAATVVPIAVGVIIAAVGSLAFIMHSDAFGEKSPAVYVQRRSAVRLILIIYAIIACLCLIAAIAIGDVAFVITTSVLVLLAAIGLALSWLRPNGW